MRRKTLFTAFGLLLAGLMMNACENDRLASVDPTPQEALESQSPENLQKGAEVSDALAFVWADQPSAPSYTPASDYQFNSSLATNTVTRLGVGYYQVNLPGLGTASGTVQVSAYGGNHKAKVNSWAPSGTTQQVLVRCFNASGAAVDGKFTLIFHKRSGTAATESDAYLWSNLASTSSFTPSLAYQWNSKGNTNTMSRISTGVYQATLPGINIAGGTVLATAYGSNATRAKVTSWGPSGGNMLVNVRCHNAGNLADAKFTLNFLDDGIWIYWGAFVYANNATAASYTPNLTYQYNAFGGSLTINRLGTGSYRVRIPGLNPSFYRTTAIVTAYGTGSEYCSVDSWSSDGSGGTYVYVRSYTSLGVAVDTRFTLLFQTNGTLIAQ